MDVSPSPRLDQPAFLPSGEPGRLRTYSGDVVLQQDSGVILYTPGKVDAVPVTFVPPDAEALAAGTEPLLAAEVTIGQILLAGSGYDHFSGAGATQVVAGTQPHTDPAWTWPNLSFQALGVRSMVLRYRLTVLTTEAAGRPATE
ncbi:hypothetical protein HNR19_001690 [Nocardioides thalensis]|uniref:Uncharacterized protein n=1 Tax=Nocardioides thalensis TaxID=1914755 RepID=A0A853C2S9_9ACTN|nr:hypothetical protein [Nocardioides thalensis]NYJ00992.1 hypothetical protein [Nocardioides thalensis]